MATTDDVLAGLPPLVPLSKVAQVLGLTPSGVYRQIERNTFPLEVVRTGSGKRVRLGDLRELIQGRDA